jgi:hypothetical protein
MHPDLASAVRQSVASGNFTRARHLWEQYIQACRVAIRDGPDPKGDLEEARQLMAWCRQMALAARAQAQAQLDRVMCRSRIAAAYGRPASLPPGSVRNARY